MTKLVIVESPAKAGTIKGYLGSGYKVVASKGHVKDLPKSTLGIDIENGFKPNYINIRSRSELIASLRKEAKEADQIFLATDPDREGEAISWHLATALDCDAAKTKRVTFNEVTKDAIKKAIKNPRKIDMNLVNSQQARRMLDRIVGYKLSPFLWHTVKSGLSAGRVQSVATKIIVDRENEIRAFVPKEYWSIDVLLKTESGEGFTAKFYGVDGVKTEINCTSDAEKIADEVKKSVFTVIDVKKSLRTKNPQPPFITSTLQQEASKKLNFRSQKTMKTAQELYEGINLGSELGGTQGIITYMRTDSLRVSEGAIEDVRAYIGQRYGEKYLPAKARTFKTRSGAQDAHEAIRPSSCSFPPERIKDKLSSDQYKLYKLIWDRFAASQMASCELDTVSVEIKAGKYDYRAGGYTVRFKGYTAVYDNEEDDEDGKGVRLPQMAKGEVLTLDELKPLQHFTEPPARYNEASLIKFLEEMGIGRPSTFTPIITTIVARDYVKRVGKSLVPTSLGEVTTKLMSDYFANIVDYKFTANMENDLDSIARGEDTYERVLSSFWGEFKTELEEAEKRSSDTVYKYDEESADIVCDKCGAVMVIKSGRYGKFAACPNYPECKNTKRLDKNGKAITAPSAEPIRTDIKCNVCGGTMLLRSGRYGEFYACENFPKCKNTMPKADETGAACPLCGGMVVKKHGRGKNVFYACSNYPKCNFSTSYAPSENKCPSCKSTLFEKKSTGELACLNSECPECKK